MLGCSLEEALGQYDNSIYDMIVNNVKESPWDCSYCFAKGNPYVTMDCLVDEQGEIYWVAIYQWATDEPYANTVSYQIKDGIVNRVVISTNIELMLGYTEVK